MTSAPHLPEAIRLEANERVDRIERDHGVKVLFAVERLAGQAPAESDFMTALDRLFMRAIGIDPAA